MFGAGFVIFAMLGAFPAIVEAHAAITSPKIRSPGNAFLQACGQTSFKSVSNDPTGHIEEQEPVTAGCQLDLCRGMLLADQPAGNIQQVSPGDSMTLSVDCTVPHGGPANVSLLDTTSPGPGVIIGAALASFDNFCPTSGPTPANQRNLAFTLPDAATVGGKCQTAGDCVVQLFWATPDRSQNYFYCVDLAMKAVAAATSSVSVGATSADPTTTTQGFSSSGFSTVLTATNTAVATSSANTTLPLAAKQTSGALPRAPGWIRLIRVLM